MRCIGLYEALPTRNNWPRLPYSWKNSRKKWVSLAISKSATAWQSASWHCSTKAWLLKKSGGGWILATPRFRPRELAIGAGWATANICGDGQQQAGRLSRQLT